MTGPEVIGSQPGSSVKGSQAAPGGWGPQKSKGGIKVTSKIQDWLLTQRSKIARTSFPLPYPQGPELRQQPE